MQNGIEINPQSSEEPHWRVLAACNTTDEPDIFFTDKKGPQREADERAAKIVCEVCVVRKECLDYALLNDQREGVWGGMTPRERRDKQKKVTDR